jgi:hypothetical protein
MPALVITGRYDAVTPLQAEASETERSALYQ